MLVCTECREPLARTRDVARAHWCCPKCRGRLIHRAVLDRLTTLAATQALLGESRAQVRARPGEAGISCPSCRRAMEVREATFEGVVVTIDSCRRCNVVWLDGGELDHLPRLPRSRVDPAAAGVEPPSSREPLVEEEEATNLIALVLTLIGVPVERDSRPTRDRPWLTWTIAGSLLVTFLIDVVSDGELSSRLAWVPSRPGRLFGLTPLLCFLVHAGWLHLIGNLYFLVVFGDNVEDHVRRKWFATLLVVATIGGSLAHAAIDSRANLPLVGASGGISGVLACYAAVWPWERIVISFPSPKYGIWVVSIPMWLFVLGWAGLQGLTAVEQAVGGGTVSGAAHLGGVVAGLAVWLGFRWCTKRVPGPRLSRSAPTPPAPPARRGEDAGPATPARSRDGRRGRARAG